MPTFRKKPKELDAVQFTPTHILPNDTAVTTRTDEVFEGYLILVDEVGPFIMVETDEGPLRCSLGDFLATGVQGEEYPIKPDTFLQLYEHTDEESLDVLEALEGDLRHAQHIAAAVLKERGAYADGKDPDDETFRQTLRRAYQGVLYLKEEGYPGDDLRAAVAGIMLAT